MLTLDWLIGMLTAVWLVGMLTAVWLVDLLGADWVIVTEMITPVRLAGRFARCRLGDSKSDDNPSQAG